MEYLNFKLPPKETFLLQEGKFDHQQHLYYEAVKHCTQFRNAIDVGAHIGLFSSKMVKDFNHVYAFEPMFYQFLEENVNVNNITIHKLGLTNKKASYKFKVREHHTGMSKIDPDGDQVIQCDVLDNFNFTDVDLLKIDAENQEHYIIQGMVKFLQNNSPVIIIEINDKFHQNDILATLRQHSYQVLLQSNADFILKKEK